MIDTGLSFHTVSVCFNLHGCHPLNCPHTARRLFSACPPPLRLRPGPLSCNPCFFTCCPPSTMRSWRPTPLDPMDLVDLDLDQQRLLQGVQHG